MSLHCYADDTQLYLPLKPNNRSNLLNLIHCLEDIKCWMAKNFLHLNESKSEVILLGPSDSIKNIAGSIGSVTPLLKPHVKNLGVIFDSALKFDKQVNAVVKASFFQLRKIAKIKQFLQFDALEKIIHTFISSRLDYCNSLYIGISQSSLSRLQLVQNAPARLLTGTRKRDHITPILASLHWLPVQFRINFKILLYVYKALNGLAPTYIKSLLTHHTTSRSLRSADLGLLNIPRSRHKLRGDRAFAVAAPRLWNSIPLPIRTAPSINSFKSRLKTHLYSQAFLDIL
ncbi:uncharacterized protein LOC129698247 [Leucoraja erinacea]|uniref:uncharacterized protein LOC129698247 n=1 Tax=Leucoraja erinaceus TaxID=7782 RepID=UPI002457BA94|nr:uncharacterized protein LOC129698247 [Leucoraja erinacea]